MKIILSLLLVAFSLFARADLDEYAQKMGFQRDYYAALAKAKKEQRPLMLVVTKAECPWCDRLEDRTFTNPTVHKRLNKEVVVVLVYKNFDEGEYPAEKFPAPFSPRIFFVDPATQKTLLIVNGYVKADSFLQELDTLQMLWRK
ncbi:MULTISPECIES: thioredoxin family protein [Sulfurimonas]|uniref:thioredoxin family protein n=1 Tax=Sulfurimonas TaxID=202746 RepID=UPI00165F72A4|nr:thioredoxin fold domain-containing protein [Sulfurimonas hydrogeniphila]